MEFPVILIPRLSERERSVWNEFYEGVASRDCTRLEGLWRRTQDKRNAKRSGWNSSADKRRRMVHYVEKYGVRGDSFVLKGFYLWLHLAFPKVEIDAYLEQLGSGLKQGKWTSLGGGKYKKGGFHLHVRILDKHPRDVKAGRRFPQRYQFLECTFEGGSAGVSAREKRHPWEVLGSGIRKKDARGRPKLVKDSAKLLEFLPAQLELGGGASVELGIPALSYLHKVFYTDDHKRGKFYLGAKEDMLLLELTARPRVFFKKSTLMMRRILKARPNAFYKGIAELRERGLLVGPVLTNNFDRLAPRAGFKEKYLRRYDETHIIPKISFDKRAKSLLVIGSHADRRKVQQAARRRGLQVIYIDPEGYESEKGFVRYPLESVQDGDILVRKKASVAIRELLRAMSR